MANYYFAPTPALPRVTLLPSGDTTGVTDYTNIQTALATGGSIGLAPGIFYISLPLQLVTNNSLVGVDWTQTTLRSVGTCASLISDSSTDSNLYIAGITFDANNIGACVTIAQLNAVNITVERCRFINAVQPAGLPFGWPVIIGGIASNAPGSAINRVRFRYNIIESCTPFLEGTVMMNITDLQIIGNTWRNLSGAQAGGLAIYAYCHNVTVMGNNFNNCGGASGFDAYIQQSDNITWTGNNHVRTAAGTSLSLINVQDVTVGLNSWYDTSGAASFGILFNDGSDRDLAHFNGNANLYNASSRVTITKQRFNGYFIPVQVYSPASSSPKQVTVNNMTDITVDGVEADGLRGFGCLVSGPNAQNIQRIEVRDFKVTSGSYSGGVALWVQGNPGFSATTVNQVGGILAAPATPTTSAGGSGNTVPAGTYTIGITYAGAGTVESLESVTTTQAVTAGQNLVITSPAAYGGAAGWYAFVSQAGVSSRTRQQVLGTPTAIGTNLTLTVNPTTTGSAPPTISNFKQAVTITAVPAGLQAGQWVSIDTAGLQEDVYCYSTGALQMTAVFQKGHATGVAVAASATINNAAPAVNGVSAVRLRGGSIVGTSSGNSTGVLATAATQVWVNDIDLTLGGGGAGARLTTTASGAYQDVRFLANGRGAINLNSATVMGTGGNMGAGGGGNTGQPATATTYTNFSGRDIDLYVTAAGTVTALTIAGVAVISAALTVGQQFRWPAGTTLVCTNTGVPTFIGVAE